MDKNSNSLLILLGSNPLPNYLSARTLKPGRIALIYTPENDRAAERYRRCLGRE